MSLKNKTEQNRVNTEPRKKSGGRGPGSGSCSVIMHLCGSMAPSAPSQGTKVSWHTTSPLQSLTATCQQHRLLEAWDIGVTPSTLEAEVKARLGQRNEAVSQKKKKKFPTS